MADFDKLVENFFNKKENILEVSQFNNLISDMMKDIICNSIGVKQLNEIIADTVDSETKKNIKISKKDLNSIPYPATDGGIMVEYLLALELTYLYKKAKLIYCSSQKICHTIEDKKKFLDDVKEYNGYRKYKEHNDEIEFVFDEKKVINYKKIHQEAKNYVKSLTNNLEFKQLLEETGEPVSIDLVGQKLQGESSGDIELKFQNENSIRLSVKRGSGAVEVYKSGKTDLTNPFVAKDPQNPIKESGGGFRKLYTIFEIEQPKDYFIDEKGEKQPITLEYLYVDFAKKMNIKYSNTPSDFLKILTKIITRDDENVKFVSVIQPKHVISTDLMNKFLQHIKNIKFDLKEETDPLTNQEKNIYKEIRVHAKADKFNILNTKTDIEQKFGNDFKEKIEKKISDVKNEYEAFSNNFKLLDSKEKKIQKQKLKNAGIVFNEESSFENFVQVFTNTINKNINDINNRTVILFRDRNDDSVIEKQSAFTAISNINYIFSYLKQQEEFVRLIEILKELLSISAHISNKRNQIEKENEKS